MRRSKNRAYAPYNEKLTAELPKISTLEEQRVAPSINIRDLSVKCGHCGEYQTLTAFSRRGDWNIYTYECENDQCDPAVTRTLLEVPRELDEFARRDPRWRHGASGSGQRSDA